MKHLSLFSGIGGFDLAAQWCGWQNVAQVEIDDFCTKVLEKNFPNTLKFRDVKKFDGRKFAGSIDVISGGFPCQPFSTAGKRKGKQDERHLWPEMFRIIREVKPSWVVAENVRGLLNIDGGVVFESVLTDLESIGFEVQPVIIPACAVGAPHRRDRLWIIAHADRNHDRLTNGKGVCRPENLPSINRKEYSPARELSGTNSDVADPHGAGLQGANNSEDERWKSEICFGLRNWDANWLEVATELCRVDDGLPKRLDKRTRRGKRLKALGNAIVPQVVFQIFNAINKNELLFPKK